MLRRQLAPGLTPPTLRFRAPSVRIGLHWLVAGWLLAAAARGLVAAVRYWRVSVPTVLAWSLWVRWGTGLLWACLLLAAILAGWRWRWPASFRRQVGDRALSRWRWVWVYRRDWQPAMVTTGLAFAPALGASLPRLRGVQSNGTTGTDVVRVRMLPGQTVDDWRAVAPKLAQVFEVRSVRVQRDLARLQDVLLVCRRRPDIPDVTEPAPAPDTGPPAPATSPFPRAPRRAS